ncbi:MAG TPA: NAD(P)H-binding protein [Burkholderiaceae bacterium]|nr:NAD(P)H-binding protein [Burkholderiaceae bacterium]
MTSPSTPPDSRVALLAGASGLIGRALLVRLLGEPRYARVHLLLRRAVPDLPAHAKRRDHVVDFERLPALPAVDDVFVALGTTIKVAGSERAFRAVDFDAVVNTARAARTAGAKRLLVVSALGADATSRVFYNRVKGEMQDEIVTLGYESVVIAQPSLLLGDRAALGQPVRAGEALAAGLLNPVLRWLPRSVRPIRADAVAQALLQAALHSRPGVTVLRSGQMQPNHEPRH